MKAIRNRFCKRCGKIFQARTKYSYICPNCQKPRGYTAWKKNKK